MTDRQTDRPRNVNIDTNRRNRLSAMSPDNRPNNQSPQRANWVIPNRRKHPDGLSLFHGRAARRCVGMSQCHVRWLIPMSLEQPMRQGLHAAELPASQKLEEYVNIDARHLFEPINCS